MHNHVVHGTQWRAGVNGLRVWTDNEPPPDFVLVLAAMQASNTRPERTTWSSTCKIRIGMSAKSASWSEAWRF
jgi:hypothetical protein